MLFRSKNPEAFCAVDHCAGMRLRHDGLSELHHDRWKASAKSEWVPQPALLPIVWGKAKRELRAAMGLPAVDGS